MVLLSSSSSVSDRDSYSIRFLSVNVYTDRFARDPRGNPCDSGKLKLASVAISCSNDDV